MRGQSKSELVSYHMGCKRREKNLQQRIDWLSHGEQDGEGS